MNIEELKRIVTGVLPDNWSYDGMVEYHKEVTPAVVMELIRQRDELLVALKDAHQVLRDWGAYIPSSTIQEDLEMLGIAIANAEKTT